MLRNRLSPGQRLLVVYALTIFGPGLLLAIFGARALWQEKQSAGRQLQSQVVPNSIQTRGGGRVQQHLKTHRLVGFEVVIEDKQIRFNEQNAR